LNHEKTSLPAMPAFMVAEVGESAGQVPALHISLLAEGQEIIF
jgi:hypothetical protein